MALMTSCIWKTLLCPSVFCKSGWSLRQSAWYPCWESPTTHSFCFGAVQTPSWHVLDQRGEVKPCVHQYIRSVDPRCYRSIQHGWTHLWHSQQCLFPTPKAARSLVDILADPLGLDRFELKWGSKYPLSVRTWRENWTELSTFWRYPVERRRIMYTTNIIEGYHRQLRKATKGKSIFPNDEALTNRVDSLQVWNPPANRYRCRLLSPVKSGGRVLTDLLGYLDENYAWDAANTDRIFRQ